MKTKSFLCLVSVLASAIVGRSASWPEKAASIRIGTSRAQVNSILPVWKEGHVLTVGTFTAESYWVSKDWMVTVWYYEMDSDVSMSNYVASPVTLDALPYPQYPDSAQILLQTFRNAKIFYLQEWVGDKLAALHDTNILKSPILTDDLTNEDREIRANAAYVFAALGDGRGFDTLQDILADRSPRPEGQGVPGGNWTLQAQIASDRYHAAHVLGDLKDPRAVPILIPLLADKDVNSIVPWSLAEIGGKQAGQALIDRLGDKDPSMRVLAIYGLGQMHAVEALPRLRQMVNDNEHCNFEDLITVGDAARGTIPELEPNPDAIDQLAASFSESDGTWDNGVTAFPIQLPPSATLDSVVARIFEEVEFDSSRRVKDYQVLKSRNVIVLHSVGEYTMALVKTDLGKKIVMTQYTKSGWWYRIYAAGD